MKRVYSMCLTALLALSLLAAPALAADQTGEQIIRFEDGSYVVITEENNQMMTLSSKGTDITPPGKRYTFYNPLLQKCFSYILFASFTYTGTTSWVKSYDYKVEIYRTGWSLENHFEYVSGGTAYGTATFREPGGKIRTAELTLSCDKNGNIS